MKKRTYVKLGIWHLGGRKKQRGGFSPLWGTIARPLLVCAAGAVGSKLLESVGKKIFRDRKRIRRGRRRIIRIGYA